MKKKIKKAMKEMAKSVSCQLYCGDGSGKPPKDHFPTCPFYDLIPERKE